MTSLEYHLDLTTGLAYVEPAPAIRAPFMQGKGHLVYRCHTCGDLIPRRWEVLFVDPHPGAEWASYPLPAVVPPTMTTHHDWHMASQED